jgi:ABC-type transporter Mla maintaining outer membrane lipid asymmetry permease subunit MlaE
MLRGAGGAGRVGSAFAAELGTMAVSEQTDSLRVLGSDPVDYLVTPRVLACMIAAPILNLMCFAMGAPQSRARSGRS